MELEIKCLDCGKRTRRFEIGPAVFAPNNNQKILLRDNIICPKCKHDISDGKCITPSGMFMISLMIITMWQVAEKEGDRFELPPHLRGIAIVSKENYEVLKKQSKAFIMLANKLSDYPAMEAK